MNAKLMNAAYCVRNKVEFTRTNYLGRKLFGYYFFYSYNTIIGFYDKRDGKWYLDGKNYSRTTSKHRNAVFKDIETTTLEHEEFINKLNETGVNDE